MTYVPTDYVLTQHAFVEAERKKHIANVNAKWEAKKQAVLAKEIKPHNPKKATKKEMKEMASWGVKYTTE